MRSVICLLTFCTVLVAQPSILVEQGGESTPMFVDSGVVTSSIVRNSPGGNYTLTGINVYVKWFDQQGVLQTDIVSHVWMGVPYDPSYIKFIPFKHPNTEQWIEIIYTYTSSDDEEPPIVVPTVRLFN